MNSAGLGAKGATGSRKVALVCQHFYPEMISTGMHMTELALSLSRLGWQIEVYCAQPSLSLESGNPRVAPQMEYEGIRISRLPSFGSHSGGFFQRFLFASSYLVSSALAVMRARKRIQGLLITTNPPPLGLVGKLASRLFGIRYLLIVYDVYPDIAVRLGVLSPASPLAWVWERFTRTILRGAAAVVVIGRDMAEIIRSKAGDRIRSRMHLIPNWSDERTVQPVPRQENLFVRQHGLEDAFVVQYSGRMARTHNLEPLVEAAALLQGLQPKVIFQFIGDGAKKEALLDLARRKKLENVQFLPYQPLSSLHQVLSAAHLSVVCLQSKFTGLSVPSKAYGVMAAAIPILGFLDPESEIGQVIRENDSGLVLADPTAQQVASALQDLSSNPQRLEQMGTNGRRAFLQSYTLAIAADRYSRLMERVFGADYSRL